MTDSSFRTVLRGYEPGQVDSRMREVNEEVRQARAAVEELRHRLAEAQRRLRANEQALEASRKQKPGTADPEQIAALKTRIKELESAAPAKPTFELLGARVGQILVMAEDEAKELTDKAKADADNARRRAEQAAEQVRHEADRYAGERKTSAEGEATRILEAARRNADEVLDAAERDAQVRRDEAEALFEQQRAKAAKAAADFETTLAQRRERSEKEFQAQTQRAEQNLSAVQAEAERVREEAGRTHIEAERAAQRMIADATQQAQELVASAKARADKIRTDSERELSAAAQRRDSINAQLTNVRQMLATLSGAGAGADVDPFQSTATSGHEESAANAAVAHGTSTGRESATADSQLRGTTRLAARGAHSAAGHKASDADSGSDSEDGPAGRTAVPLQRPVSQPAAASLNQDSAVDEAEDITQAIDLSELRRHARETSGSRNVSKPRQPGSPVGDTVKPRN